VETQGKALGVTKQESSENPHVFAVTVLRACQGVSAAVAEKLLEGCGGSLEGVWKASAADLAAIQCGKVRFGAVRGGRLWGLLHAAAAATAPPTDQTEPRLVVPAAVPAVPAASRAQKPAVQKQGRFQSVEVWARPMFE
jgi:hypothetical protein